MSGIQGQPVPLPASKGGTGNTGGAWSAFTPTLTAQSGTFGATPTTSCHWKRIDSRVTATYDVTIANVGTATGAMFATLPIAAVRSSCGAGIDVNVGGKQLRAFVNSATQLVNVAFYDAASAIAINRLVFEIEYECAPL